MDYNHYITEAHMAIFGDAFEFNACLIYVNVCFNRNLEHIVKCLLFLCIRNCKGGGGACEVAVETGLTREASKGVP